MNPLDLGWIALYRKIRDHPFFRERRNFSRFEAWIDLLLRASHEEKDFKLGKHMVHIKQGEFVTSEYHLAQAWGWPRSKVHRFLRALEVDHTLDHKSTSKWTTFRIVNWDSYQLKRTTLRSTGGPPSGLNQQEQKDSVSRESLSSKRDGEKNAGFKEESGDGEGNGKRRCPDRQSAWVESRLCQQCSMLMGCPSFDP
jgi:hypothetical protein